MRRSTSRTAVGRGCGCAARSRPARPNSACVPGMCRSVTMLAWRGAGVVAVLLSPERVHRAGLAALRAAGGRVSDDARRDLGRADLVVDGIVGIGGRGGLRAEAAQLLDAVGGSALVVAVDLP